MNRHWGNSNAVGALYRANEDRFGNDQKGVRTGDLVLCLRHAGDHYYYFMLVTERDGRLTGHPDIQVGSYSFGGILAALTDREYHLLAAGETIAKP